MMTSTDVRRYLLYDHRNISFIGLATVISTISFQLAPAAIPIILNLSVLLTYFRIFMPRHGALKYGTLLCLGLTIGGALPKLKASSSALSSLGVSLMVLLAATGLTSVMSMFAVFLDTKFCMSFTSHWSQVTLFPSLWASLLGGVAYISPIGRLSAWSPTEGVDAYSWLVPFLGPAAIDWIVAAWAVVLSQAVAAWIMNEANGPEEPLLHNQVSSDTVRRVKSSQSQSKSSWRLACTLMALAIPSYVLSSYPAPIAQLQHVTPLSVACVLPPSWKYKHHTLTLDDYIAESKKLTGSAKILLWPESAVVFTSEFEKEAAFQKIQKLVLGSYVGVSFEEAFADPKDKTGLKSARRNGLALISKDSEKPHLVYYKRSLVPIAESFSLTHSEAPPQIFTLELPHPSDVNKTDWASNLNHTRPIPITTSICLDFAAPNPFKDLGTRPALILAPARTWDIDIGITMWKQAKQRAEELGTTILWCDGGEGGVSGVAGKGMNDVQQVGPGSWFRTISLDYPHQESRTIYATIGGFGLFFFWFITLGTSISEHMIYFLPGGIMVKKIYDIVAYAVLRVQGWRGGERQPLLAGEEQGSLVDL
ncbi:hypothetical protein APHAL10511_006066 [Amanita phalloides]|nr:hypothetical protein APHAL10511_006066 [Amanita phalloides]